MLVQSGSGYDGTPEKASPEKPDKLCQVVELSDEPALDQVRLYLYFIIVG